MPVWDDFAIETAYDRQEAALFLERSGLGYDAESDITLVIRRVGRIVGTGSLRGNVLQCFAVEQGLQGMGLASKLVDRLTQLAFERGHTQLFVFTTPVNVRLFRDMGFRLLTETGWAALLESGLPTIDDFLHGLSGYDKTDGGTVGGLVMNCNPFTLGHQHLVEQAAQACDHVFLLVVEEDRSAFPFHVRLELVKRGTAHLRNVTVLSAGPYAVSLATFPSYFTAEETAHAQAGASIDATIYARYIARALGIKRRFVGTEPLSKVTAIYNQTLRQVLGQYGIELVEIPRLETQGRPISASLVRDALRRNDYAALTALVPESTREFLLSEQAASIIQRLKQQPTRH